MKVCIYGPKIHDFSSFCDAVAEGIMLAENSSAPGYFGFDLHSFGDCLQGGFLGVPPYEIEVADGEAMVEALVS